MKNTLVFVAFLLFAIFSNAQINPQTPWTWMKGDNTINQKGNYGIINVASSANKPGARNYSTTWTDANGNLWLFGGSGYGTRNVGYLNDLWKFDPIINKWIWMKGDSVTRQYSVYGTLGTTNATNKPGAIFSGVSWTDANHNLWLFGGFGFSNTAFGFLNSIWKYNTASNNWTWIKGDSTINEPGNYGVQGIESATNKPGARYGSQTWTDASGNLWLYGGYGYDESSSGILNDIWKFSPSTNKWTWIKGDNVVEQVGFFGTKGIPNASNKPGARYASCSWTDEYDNLWLFGGYGYDENKCGDLNDLWKYNPLTNEWTWISGDNVINQPGLYGEKGVPDAKNKPGARYVGSSWMDFNGDLWIYGGYGYDAAKSGYLNDLWKYNRASNQWTWVKGDSIIDQLGVYGTQGMPDTSNKSGARNGSASWSDGNGNLWMFGGYGFDGNTTGVLNDLWKIKASGPIISVNLLQFTGVLNNEAAQLNWKTEQENIFSHFKIERSFDEIHFSTIGTVSGTGNNNTNYYSFTDDLRNQQPQKIYYRLKLVNKNGHFTYSNVLQFDLIQSAIRLKLFPNPAVNLLNLSFALAKQESVQISIIDLKGIIIKQETETLSAGRINMNIDVSALPAGVYILSVKNEESKVSRHKFIKH